MASCPYCTAQIAPGLYQCPNCGSPLTPVDQSMTPMVAQPVMPPQPIYTQQPMYPAATEPVVPTRSWIGYLLLCACMPVLGSIITLCTAKENSVKNFAKAFLILIGIGCAALFLLLFFAIFLDSMY